MKIIDLSADFRLRDTDIYEQWYKIKHETPDMIGKAVYGLSEMYREQIAGASLVANPGRSAWAHRLSGRSAILHVEAHRCPRESFP